MQSNPIDEAQIVWKKLGEGMHVAHFSSRVNSHTIYLKKIDATKIKKNPTTIFLFHDVSSYHGRFLNLTDWFKVQYPEISFIMMDFLGHGLSSGTRGHVARFGELASDVATVFEMLEKKPGESWVALGHGMGALSLLDLLNRYNEPSKDKIDKLIFSNFVLNFSSPLLSIQNKIMKNFMYLDGAMKSFRPMEIYLPSEVLSTPKEQTKYLEDPLIVRRPTFQTLQNIAMKVKSIYQDSYFLDRPTLLLKSEGPYLFSSGMDSFSKGLKKGLLTEKKYSNLKHDLYNEKENTIVFNDIAAWVQS